MNYPCAKGSWKIDVDWKSLVLNWWHDKPRKVRIGKSFLCTEEKSYFPSSCAFLFPDFPLARDKKRKNKIQRKKTFVVWNSIYTSSLCVFFFFGAKKKEANFRLVSTMLRPHESVSVSGKWQIDRESESVWNFFGWKNHNCEIPLERPLCCTFQPIAPIVEQVHSYHKSKVICLCQLKEKRNTQIRSTKLMCRGNFHENKIQFYTRQNSPFSCHSSLTWRRQQNKSSEGKSQPKSNESENWWINLLPARHRAQHSSSNMPKV